MELLLRALSIELRRCVISPRTLSIAKLKNLVNFSIQEIRMTRLADLSICVSEPDARFLRQGALCTSVQSLETGLSPFEFEYELSDNYLLYPVESKQKTVLYMAYFGSETNILALEWFVQNVHPLIKERVADYSLLVAGRGDLSRFRKFEDGNLEIMGEFESVAAIASQAKVGIAPALSGSGFRGKINQYAICGVPCVASPIAAEGLAYQNGSQIFVESSPRLFAERCVSLMTDNALNQAVRSAAREVCLNNYTWESKLRETRSIYEIEDPPKIPIHGKVTAIVPSYNHGQFLVDRIKSIQEQTYRNIELIVVDDCSTDDSDAVIREMMSIKPFMYLRTPVNSGSPFGPWKQALERATGDYIWICESDDFCAPDFVEHAMRCMSTHPDAALFYCSSKIVNENNEVIGHTDAYFHDIWKESRWDHDFKSKGRIEIADFQVRGQTVPNLSSAIFSADAFGKALGTDLTNFRLTGDWLFVARIMQFGDVLYSREVKNCYRSHNNTARNRVDSARSQAEFIITKSIIFRLSGFPVSRFAGIMSSDAVRFIHEEPKWHEVIRQMISVSITESLRCLGLLTCSLMMNPVYLKAYISRLKLARSIGRVEVNGKN
jgi:glycosyltransferase involved in cell wall biosynthesis